MITSSGEKILIIEDEPDVIEMLSRAFKRAGGFEVLTSADGAAGLARARNELPALVILDLMLPGMPGLEICKLLKSDARTQNIPIIMLSAKTEEVDRIVGFEIGADDYVSKPFSPREVVLRVHTILRRGDIANDPQSLQAGPITIDSVRHRVLVSGEAVNLTNIEFKLLSTLIQRRGHLQERDRLLHDVWGYDGVVHTRTVDTHVRRLREKLGKAGDAIETVRAFGYRLRDI